MTRCDVIIVGAGMGGAVLALLAASRGRRVLLLDRRPDGPQEVLRGELLQPNGLAILDRVGLLSGLKPDHVARIRRFHFYRIGRRRLVTIDYAVLSPPYNYTLCARPSAVMGPLVQRLAATPGVVLRWGHQVQRLLREGDRVVGVEARANGRSHQLFAPVVIGADGPLSPVRTALGIRARVKTYRDGYLTMILPRPPCFGDDGRYYVGRREILGVFPLGAESIYAFYLWPAATRSRLTARGLDAFTARVAAIDPDLAPAVHSVTDWNQVGWMPCLKVVSPVWTADGAALLGDAAHALNPHVAQGRNQALEDAVALDTVLESCAVAGDFSRTALGRYEQRRRPTIEVLQGLGDEMAFFWNAPHPLIGWIRDRVFATLDRDQALRRTMLELVAGLSDRNYTTWDRVRALGWR